MATQSETIGKLAEALARAQQQLKGATKDHTNPHLGNRYADLGSVWDACREALSANGLSVMQTCVLIRPEADVDKGAWAVETTLAHSSGEFTKGQVPLIFDANGKLNPMQAMGSAISYARRYALSAIVGIVAEDDDGDGAGRPSMPPASRPEQRREAPQGQRQQPRQFNGQPVGGRPQGGGNGKTYGPPKTGKGLFAWSRENDRVKEVNAYGKVREWGDRMIEWHPDQVAEVYAYLTGSDASTEGGREEDEGPAY